jgi:hypothetical protein
VADRYPDPHHPASLVISPLMPICQKLRPLNHFPHRNREWRCIIGEGSYEAAARFDVKDLACVNPDKVKIPALSNAVNRIRPVRSSKQV